MTRPRYDVKLPYHLTSEPMNFCSVCAQLADNPREVFTSATSTGFRCSITLPRVGNKAPTTIEYNSYGKNADRLRQLTKGNIIHIHGAKLRYDLESKSHSLHGGVIAKVDDTFPLYNTVILTGRCVKDIQGDDRAFRTTADGLMICNQTLSVATGRNQADLFNFYAINTAQDKLNNAELLLNFTRKGTGLTIQGRLVTDEWQDRETKERRSNTKIQLVSMTLAPKMGESQTKPVTSQTTVASESNVTSLWGNRTVEEEEDPWTRTSGGGLPDLPGQYGNAPNLSDEPF